MQKITNQELGRPSAENYARMQKLPFVVVLDNIRSLNNVGSFFRTCDAFAISHIALCGITATPPNKEIHKTALGAENTVEWSQHSSTLEAVEKLRAEGYKIIAVEQVQGAVMLNDFRSRANDKYALVFGNEVFGVSQEVVDKCDMSIEIPQVGTKHSLNVSVSAGVVLWHFFEEHMLLGQR